MIEVVCLVGSAISRWYFRFSMCWRGRIWDIRVKKENRKGDGGRVTRKSYELRMFFLSVVLALTEKCMGTFLTRKVVVSEVIVIMASGVFFGKWLA